jgi:nitrate reductase NapE component
MNSSFYIALKHVGVFPFMVWVMQIREVGGNSCSINKFY